MGTQYSQVTKPVGFKRQASKSAFRLHSLLLQWFAKRPRMNLYEENLKKNNNYLGLKECLYPIGQKSELRSHTLLT